MSKREVLRRSPFFRVSSKGGCDSQRLSGFRRRSTNLGCLVGFIFSVLVGVRAVLALLAWLLSAGVADTEEPTLIIFPSVLF